MRKEKDVNKMFDEIKEMQAEMLRRIEELELKGGKGKKKTKG
jgi:hypothetical protein